MRDRLYMAARNSSSRGHVGGRGPWRRGFCDARGNGGAYVGGDEHFRSVSEENYVHRAGWRGDAGGYGCTSVPPPVPHDVGSPLPHPPPQPSGFRHQAPPYFPVSGPRGAFRPPPTHGAAPRQQWSRPPPPADFRKWISSSLPAPPPECGRFTVLSYNILADYLAREHQSKLYFHIPDEILDWEWRKNRLLIEFGLWSPDIMCLQEVDRFLDLEEELSRRGYNGVWKMRTGNAVDGCAVFWRACRFVLRHEEHIEFAKLGLRDNVAQICVLESKSPAHNRANTSPSISQHSPGTDWVVVCNIHVLYNPKRGEVKLGQVRTLLNQAHSVSKNWEDAPVIICGDFNCTPKSPLYNFICEQKLSLSGLARNEVSGQYSPIFYPPRTFTRDIEIKSNYDTKFNAEMELSAESSATEEKNTVILDREEVLIGTSCDSSSQTSSCVILTTEELTVIETSQNRLKPSQNLTSPGAKEELTLNSTSYKWTFSSEISSSSNPERTENLNLEILTSNDIISHTNGSHALESSYNNNAQDLPLESSSCTVDEREDDSSNSSFLEELHGTTFHKAHVDEPSLQSSSYPDPYLWTPMEIAAASGDPERMLIEHDLNLSSVYTEVEDYGGTRDGSREPKVTSYNRKFMGTVDYIWRSEGLQTVRVLDTIPQNVMRRTSGFPTRKWGSDHIALACEFVFRKN